MEVSVISWNTLSRKIGVTALWILVFCMGMSSAAHAENRVGGHIGFVLPLVTHLDGHTETISDDFVIGFPVGITIRKSEKVAFDFEFEPEVQKEPLEATLIVHPGVIWTLPHEMEVGLRLAVDVKGDTWGFTPLINRSFKMTEGTKFFAELVVPIRIHEIKDDKKASIGIGIHFGVGF